MNGWGGIESSLAVFSHIYLVSQIYAKKLGHSPLAVCLQSL
jgi:hypothetical protein